MASGGDTNIAIIGAGKMALDCLARALEQDGTRPSLVITSDRNDMPSRRLADWCARHAVPLHDTADPNSNACLAQLRQAAPAVIFNINSFAILRRPLLAIPPLGVVNFHNGPLPGYAGMNIPTWAIWNDEKTHGVSWHFVDEGVDTGDVIACSSFPLDPRETAATLTMKCIVEGIRMFDSVLQAVLAGDAPRTPQAGRRTCYRQSWIPHDGRLDLDWPARRLDRLVRALDFHPLPNPLGPPRIRLGSGLIGLGRVTVTPDEDGPSHHAPGTILGIEADRLVLRCLDGKLVVRACFDTDGTDLSVTALAQKHGLAPGMLLS